MRIRFLQSILFSLLLFAACAVTAAGEKPGAAPRFDIIRYQIEGNTLLPKDKLTSILSPFTGKGKDFGTVQQAIETLEQAYRSRGFTVVGVVLPEQELENGVVRLRVIENRIRKIVVEGNRFFKEENIRSGLPTLRQGETPDIDEVSRNLNLMNENPARKINLSFMNTDQEGLIDAKVDVKDERPWKVGLTADNTGTRESTRYRTGVLLQHANLFNLDHVLTLQYITSPGNPGDVGIYSVGYHIPVYGFGSSIDLIGAYSSVDSGTISAGDANLNVSGKGTILGVHYNQNLTRIGSYEHKITLALDYRAYENNVDFSGIQLGSNVTVHPVSLTYAGAYGLDKLNAGFYVMDIQNLGGNWDGRDNASNFENARAGAARNYNIVRGGANVTYALPRDWQVRVVMNGQYTGDKLVPGEQYGIGGASTVRGFQEREYANDYGCSGSAEVYTPDIFKLFDVKALQLRFLAFYDRGYVQRNAPLPGEMTSTEMASMGPGLRLTDGKRFSVSADWGFVLDPPDATKNRWDNIVHVSASVMF